MPHNITRRQAIKRLLGGSMGLLLASTGMSSLLSSCTSSKEREMRRQKAAADASLLTGCTYCRDCEPCPYGVSIADVMRNYDLAVKEGRLPDPAREKPKLLQHDVDTYNEKLRRIPRLSEADRCIGCNRCHCKENIDIPIVLRRIEDIEEVVRDMSI